MPTDIVWQKSSFSGEAANCVNVAITPGGAIRLRESEAPGTILATSPEQLGAFLTAIKRNRAFAESPHP